jgi:choline dehydrogenase
MGKIAQRLWIDSPLRKYVNGPLFPPVEDIMYTNVSEALWTASVQGGAVPAAHGIGTAAMMRRELGGVVDSELRVYGTENVRVVDASVYPVQIVGHPTASLYGVAERASDIIKRTCWTGKGKRL